jgi:hypothetical protein
MQKIKNLHDVSAIYFFLFAFIYVTLALFLRNGYYTGFSVEIMKLIDIPFAFISLLYGGTSLTLQLENDEETLSPWVIVIFAICLLLFGGVVFVNFAFPSTL